MDEIAAFLSARLDEDETAALAAGDDDTARSWTSFDIGGYPVIGAGIDNGWGITVAGPPAPSEAQARHIARHDPGRALREVEAGRRILYDHAPQAKGQRTVCSRCHYGNPLGANWPCLTMESLAAVYSDHPDYRPEWAPGS